MPAKKKQTQIDDWRPTGSTLFSRVVGTPYTAGNPFARLSGKGSPAGAFKRGPFRLGR